MPKSLETATPKRGGVSKEHIDAIWKACQDENCFLIVRPSELQTINLIDLGYPTKNMDVHDKSSNWGLTAGMVPVDKALSKKKDGFPVSTIDALTLKEKGDHGRDYSEDPSLRKIQLIIPDSELQKLQDLDHFVSTKVEGCRCGFPAEEYEHWHSKTNKKENENELLYCFLRKKSGEQKGAVSWCWRNPTGIHPNTPLWDGTKGFPFPVYVWAYPEHDALGQPIMDGEQPKFKAVTGDYDMWMIAPHISRFPAEGEERSIQSKPDPLNRGLSASIRFTRDLLPKLNKACKRPFNTVFNHGAEAQNFSFTQEIGNDVMAAFCPGTAKPFTLAPKDAPRLVFDMLEHGYVATLNPKWRFGHTLANEDLAYKWEETLTSEERSGREAWERQQNERARARGVPEVAISDDAWEAILGLSLRAGTLDPGTSDITPKSGPEASARAAVGKREDIAARLIQRAWRGHKVRKLEAEVKGELPQREDISVYTSSPEPVPDHVELLKTYSKLAMNEEDVATLREEARLRGIPETEFEFLRDRIGHTKHREKFAIFRKIARAATPHGIDDYDAIEFPETCFKVVDVGNLNKHWWTKKTDRQRAFDENNRREARRLALEQEGGFGRLGYEDFGPEGHKHSLPVDGTGVNRPSPGNKPV